MVIIAELIPVGIGAASMRYETLDFVVAYPPKP